MVSEIHAVKVVGDRRDHKPGCQIPPMGIRL